MWNSCMSVVPNMSFVPSMGTAGMEQDNKIKVAGKQRKMNIKESKAYTHYRKTQRPSYRSCLPSPGVATQERQCFTAQL